MNSFPIKHPPFADYYEECRMLDSAPQRQPRIATRDDSETVGVISWTCPAPRVGTAPSTMICHPP
eukprot:scaffold17400_cov95-Amphora_coffeaeformis.AAC.1